MRGAPKIQRTVLLTLYVTFEVQVESRKKILPFDRYFRPTYRRHQFSRRVAIVTKTEMSAVPSKAWRRWNFPWKTTCFLSMSTCVSPPFIYVSNSPRHGVFAFAFWTFTLASPSTARIETTSPLRSENDFPKKTAMVRGIGGPHLRDPHKETNVSNVMGSKLDNIRVNYVLIVSRWWRLWDSRKR